MIMLWQGLDFASKNYKRMNASIKLSCLFSFVSGIIFLIFAFIFSKELIAIFIKNDEVIEYGSKFLIAAYSVAPIIGFQFVFISTFQALGKAYSRCCFYTIIWWNVHLYLYNNKK